MKNISIAGFSFHGLLAEGKIDIFGYLETLKYRYHIEVADIWNRLLESTEEDYIKKVREALDERDMTLANIAVDGASVWDDDPAVREKYHQNALAHLKAAEILGAKTVRIDWGVNEPELTPEQFDFIANRYKEYCDIADKAGFKVGPENHFGAALNPNQMKKMIEKVDHPAYKILLHLGHWDVNEAKGDEMMAPCVMHTHVDQNIVENCLKESLTTLIKAGYAGCWGVEHHSAENEYAQIEWQLASVRRALTFLDE